MKKFMFFMLLFLTAIGIGVAQDVLPPDNLVDVVTNLPLYAASLLGLSVLSVFITGLVNGLLTTVKKWIRQVVSWLVPIVIAALFTFVLKIGFLVDEPILSVLLYGLGAGLVSNGIFDISFIKTAIVFIEQLLKKEE
jgi:hypothetical protein